MKTATQLGALAAALAAGALALGGNGAPQGAAPLSASQSTATQSSQAPLTIHVNVDEVLLNLTVLDKQSKSVDGLAQANFTVFENGVLQHPDFFSHDDAPVSVGIVVDNSGSMREKREEVAKAAVNFVRASNEKDQVFIVNFNDEYYLDAPFTNDISKMQAGLGQIESRGGTALYDAIIASLDYLMHDAANNKRVLLVVTDGNDNASRYTLEQAVRTVQQENAPLIYCIGLLDSEDGPTIKRSSQRALRAFSDATGGVSFFPKDLGQVDSITRQVAQDIRMQYTIEYKSNQSGPGYRTIRVEVKSPKMKGLSVRTRAGYYQDDPHAATDNGGPR